MASSARDDVPDNWEDACSDLAQSTLESSIVGATATVPAQQPTAGVERRVLLRRLRGQEQIFMSGTKKQQPQGGMGCEPQLSALKEEEYRRARSIIFGGSDSNSTQTQKHQTISSDKNRRRNKLGDEAEDIQDPDFDRDMGRWKRADPGFAMQHRQRQNAPARGGQLAPARTYDTEFPSLS